jgi:regulatory protein
VHGEVIEKAVSGAYSEVNDEQLARAFLRRKRLQKPSDQKQAARIFRTLARAGFTSRVIVAILKKWDVDEELLSAVESEPAP